MPYNPIRDEVAIASTALNLLERDVMLASTVWRDPIPANTFARKKNDTISIHLPAYAVANSRTLRANAARQRQTLHERKVDVTLTDNLQIDVALSDENLTLDLNGVIRNVVAPSVGGIVRGYEQAIADTLSGGVYANTVQWDASDPYNSLVDAATFLDDSAVPATDRHFVVGSKYAADLKKSGLLSQVHQSGSSQTLRRGIIGEVAGFTVLTSQFLGREEAYAYHRTAVALVSRAPMVPDGVAWGSVQSANGFAIRVMQHLGQDDNKDLLNIVYHDSWLGCAMVTDNGTINGEGKFIPATEPGQNGASDLLVRAVKLGSTVTSS